MSTTNSKQKIQSALQSFSEGNLTENALNLFQTLGYNTERRSPLDKPTFTTFKESFIGNQSKFNKEKAMVSDWKYVDLLFQLSKEEILKQVSRFDTKPVDRTIIETYLFFTIELAKEHYSRTALSHITREVNRLFPMPVMVLFKYGSLLTLSVINRRLHKGDAGKDVLEKVTLIKDIRISPAGGGDVEIPLKKGGEGVVSGDVPVTHRAHIEILFDLSFDELKNKHGFTNFVELNNAWQKTLDTSELNKRFFRELANWYFWAMGNVEFPDDLEKKTDVRNATNLIRLITRLVFIWFIKEKDLLPDSLFNKNHLNTILNGFNKDSASNVYYHAILQNLFFGTLNQKMGERGFAKEGSFPENKNEYGVKNLFRYADKFSIKEKEVIELFKDVPFLNGGLFDCLDKQNDEGKVVYGDGFSRNPKKQANVPDFLFFSDELEVDLNEIFGTKNKKYTAKGIINLLDSYKFTVAENTPIEEEIALDPELLGKVFENLLASYNPETQTTARKQTGSFYTPREIVNYMVDESLLAYLKQKLEGVASGDSEARLRGLLSYSENPNPFNEKETQALIAAIDTGKILDPACGSGAFPMGVLHKLVHILHKLDPRNELWKQKQIEKALQLDDPNIRDHATQDIEEAFENNELDYGRKLYLIENCIYGVDVQPIAVQIAKLRFFISLIIDEKKQPDRENLGVRSLPNLETKFVAANTLIGIEKPQQRSFKTPELGKLEKDLKQLRHQYFNAKTRKEKLHCQKQDKELRQSIAKLLMTAGWDVSTARQIVQFDPYDQNASSPFFDLEWMFGIKRGFDVVIGNPPYVQIQSFSGMPQQKDWERQKYETYTKTGDVYCLFYERGYRLLKDGGVLTFITSNKWMRANYGKVMRKFFTGNGTISQLIDFGDSPIFENATTYTNILVWMKDKQKAKTKAWDLSKVYASDVSLDDLLVQQGEYEPLFNENSFVVVKSAQTAIKKRIEEIGVPLKDWNISIYRGILTGLNEAFIIDGKKKDELIAKDPKSAEIIKPILRGRDIKRYKAEFADLWLINTHNGYTDKNGRHTPRVDVKKDYPAIWEYFNRINKDFDGKVEKRVDQGSHWTNLRNCAYIQDFAKPKVIFGRFMDKPTYTFDKDGLLINDALYFATPATQYLAAILNSKVNWFYLSLLCTDLANGFLQALLQYQVQIPVPQIPSNKQLLFEILVDCILFCKERNLKQESDLFESVIDGMVYELYFLDEIKATNGEVLKHIAKLPEFKDDWNDEKKLAVIEKIYKELSDPKHPVTIAMEKMQEIPEVKIIEGKGKK
ncbi:MAG: hypothetical protein HW390_345 [Candidatus Brocadiaceae bacterium]|nr:hypothetical protein [Candidatus Brocadiaceae bacterium]